MGAGCRKSSIQKTRWQRRRRRCFGAMPSTATNRRERREGRKCPWTQRLRRSSRSTGSLVGRRLAIIGDDINERYDAEFRYMLKSLQPTKDNAYEYFTRIASSLFESGINWGRVIALLGFGYHMAMHVCQHGMPGFFRRIAHYVAEFVLRNRIAQWIAQQGGWVAALDLDNVYMKYMLVVVALVMVGHLVVRRFFRP
ncbi:bcl-2 homologous antagonist/killer isoform X2 [Grus americana]|uniref:bcl-2 homologous antagonist/killer isoform X2 n=1 Tax=Grus americana TaxID=9117 RepID=UPI0024084187|nr:bcl-2 homologous antagonist/killer isoform X2 [Grus americana]XP_054659675.1 bcl-2 homologous antagonist/killer isoform X2 [Grus americana]